MPFLHLLWRNVCLGFLPVFSWLRFLVFFFFFFLNIKLYELNSVPLLEIYLEKTLNFKWYIYTSVFTAALFIIAKTWMQPKYPLTYERIKNMWYIYIQGDISQPWRRNELMPFAETCLDLEISILSEVSQRKTNIIWYCLYVESK